MGRKKGILAVVVCAALILIPLEAAGYYRTKKVQYVNASLYYNGVKKNLSSQPIIIDGTTYLPVRALSNAVGMQVSWNGSALNITSNSYGQGYSMQAELQAKEYEIASLNKEVERLKNQLGIVTSTTTSTSGNSSYTQTTGQDIIGSELTATERDLRNKYSDYFQDIDFDFSVSLASNRVKVVISYDTSSENRAFNKLSNSEVRSFIRDVCETVRNHHDNIVITGMIRYDGSSKYSFTYSKNDSLSFSTGSSSYTSYNNDITESKVRRIVESAGSVSIDDYSSTLKIQSGGADISDSRKRVVFQVYLKVADYEDIKKAWNDNTGTNTNKAIRNALRDIADEIADSTDYDIEGRVYDHTNGKDELIANYDYNDNELVTYKAQ